MIKPMLAHKLNAKRKPPYPFYVQPKLNGIRAVWDGEFLWSRDGHTFSPICLPHIYAQLQNLPPLDGELYCHGMSLQQINSRCAVNRTSPHGESLSIIYNVFDAPSYDIFQDRLKTFEQLNGPHVKAVYTVLVNSTVAEETCYKLFKRDNYEGMMYRHPHAPYGFVNDCGNKENRWTCLLKRKDWLDMQCVILEVLEGEGAFEGKVGSFLLRLPNGKTVKAGSGLRFLQRTAYWASPPIGKTVTINYEMLSDGGIPLKPTIELVHE
jgi:DNA ligase 1